MYYSSRVSDIPLKKPRRKLTSLELSAPARGTLCRIKRKHGINKTNAIERGLVMLETKLEAV